MPIAQLNPYLIFDGTASEAIALYETALDAKVEHVQRFADVPGMETPDTHKARIIHAMLKLGGGMLMISDGPPGDTVNTGGDNVQVCLDFTDVDEMSTKFEALSRGGAVGMPLQDTFWGARFGTLTDAYGVKWMFNCQLPKE